MEKYLCSYEQSIALKELGFNDECLCTYYPDGRISRNPSTNMGNEPIDSEPYTWKNSEIHSSLCTAPLKSQAFEFFITKFNQIDYPEFNYEEQKWFCHSNYQVNKTYFDTKEEAENACIDNLIQICKG